MIVNTQNKPQKSFFLSLTISRPSTLLSDCRIHSAPRHDLHSEVGKKEKIVGCKIEKKLTQKDTKATLMDQQAQASAEEWLRREWRDEWKSSLERRSI